MSARLDRHLDRACDENQVFMRDMHRRSELVTQQIISDHQEFMRELKASGERSELKTDQILAELRKGREEWREESRAHREALFALIDRLPPAAAA